MNSQPIVQLAFEMVLSMPKLALTGFALATIFVCTLTAQPPPSEKRGEVFLEYLGAAGWRISDGTIVILIDPYLSRIIGPPPRGRPFSRAPGDARPVYGWDDAVEPNIDTIDSHVKRADFILVTHTHYDHVLDVPHITLKTGATVVGTESTENVMRAYGVPEEQLITVRGGGGYQVGAFSLKGLASRHSPLDRKHYFNSEKAPDGMK